MSHSLNPELAKEEEEFFEGADDNPFGPCPHQEAFFKWCQNPTDDAYEGLKKGPHPERSSQPTDLSVPKK